MQVSEGIVKTWKDEKGFGFIQPNGGGKDVFIHIRDLKHSSYKPQVGDNICFKVVTDKDGKVRAYDAFIKGLEISRQQPRKSSFSGSVSQKPKVLKNNIFLLVKYLIATLPFIFSAILIKQKIIFLPFFIYLLMSLLTFFVYAVDKTKAHKNQWRIEENTLHLFEFFGGWPGALITQGVIRHKNKKKSFQVIFWIIVIIHLIGWIDGLFIERLGISDIITNFIQVLVTNRIN